VEEAIKVYKHLHVQLLFCSYPVPLSWCFFYVRSAKLTLYSVSEKIPSLRTLWLTKPKEFYEHCNQHCSIKHSSGFKYFEAE